MRWAIRATGQTGSSLLLWRFTERADAVRQLCVERWLEARSSCPPIAYRLVRLVTKSERLARAMATQASDLATIERLFEAQDQTSKALDAAGVRSTEPDSPATERLLSQAERVALLAAELDETRTQLATAIAQRDEAPALCRRQRSSYRELAAARAVVGEAWFVGGASLAEAIARKTAALERIS